ncbi:MAG: hypothetical protein M1840_003111 [Geoglossum simile]|nr:MAG: hypothetical protein M1840_003111 [Geoglossum simile]
MQPLVAAPTGAFLVYRAWSRKSLTPAGIAAAVATATIHAIHPWSVFFALLVVFYLGGTTVTKVKHDVKARLTLSASGSSGGEGPRTHIQVLANSFVASFLILLHAWHLASQEQTGTGLKCWPWGGDALVVGIVANYAAVAADTFSSELGILSRGRPRLITSVRFRQVPPGTNGGITLYGTLAGLLGSFTIALTSVLLLPFCGTKSLADHVPAELRGLQGGVAWGIKEKTVWVVAITIWGGLGSLLDSFLGGWLQASVVDIRTGKIVEGMGGRKVLIHPTGPSSMQFSNTAKMRALLSRSGNVADSVERVSGEDVPEGKRGDDVGNPRLDRKSQRQRSGQKSEKQIPELGFVGQRHERRPSRQIESGVELLDNNAVNALMALTMSIGGIVITAWYWGIPLGGVIEL